MKFIWLSLFLSSLSLAQSNPEPGFGRIQLNDVNIEGEANSDAMRFSQRDIADISKKLNIRTNFIDRVRELGPRDWKKDEPVKQ